MRAGGTRLVVVLTALVLVASGVSLWLALSRPDITSAADLRPSTTGAGYRPAALVGPGGAALATAVEAAPLVLGYDYRTLDDGLAQAQTLLTPEFADAFAASFRTSVAPEALAEQRASVAVVRAGGLVRADDEEAVCLLFVDQRLSEAGGEPAVRRQRVLVSLEQDEQDDGTWLVSGLREI